MNIDITPQPTDGLERRLTVTVPVHEVRTAERRAAQRYASRAKIPGFRPGKVPEAVILKRFGDAVRQEAIEQILQEAYKEVLEREKLKVAGQPHVHDLKFDEGQPLVFELHLEIHPEVELARTNGFTVERPARQVSDEDVTAQIEQLREQRASWAPVDEKAREGDMVTVLLATADESGTVGEGKEYRLELGGGQAIAGIEELVMETAPGQTSERPVRWPDDFPDEAQRGVTKTVRVTVQDVKRKTLPDLDDALARELGEFDSLDALRDAVRKDMESHNEREVEAEIRQKLMDEVISANPFAVPQSWVQRLMDAYVEAYQVPETEKERFAQEFRPVAERQVRRDLVIEKIAAQENLTATEADIDAKVSEVAEKRGADPGQVYASLQKAGRLQELERGITEDKVFDWLKSRNEVRAV